MTRDDILTCVHEPFGDAFYFGPERLSTRYEDDEEAREASGFAKSTFRSIFERIEREGKEVRSALLRYASSCDAPIPISSSTSGALFTTCLLPKGGSLSVPHWGEVSLTFLLLSSAQI